jgi:hydrogenase nickel incorporation protein HypA/HybF
MHELSIASAILDAVRVEAEKRPGARVTKVGVQVGALSGVEPDALSFGFECLVKGTDLDPLALAIECVPRRQRCPACDFSFEAADGDLACPRCGRADTQLAGGDELNLAYLEMEEDGPHSAGEESPK